MVVPSWPQKVNRARHPDLPAATAYPGRQWDFGSIIVGTCVALGLLLIIFSVKGHLSAVSPSEISLDIDAENPDMEATLLPPISQVEAAIADIEAEETEAATEGGTPEAADTQPLGETDGMPAVVIPQAEAAEEKMEPALKKDKKDKKDKEDKEAKEVDKKEDNEQKSKDKEKKEADKKAKEETKERVKNLKLMRKKLESGEGLTRAEKHELAEARRAANAKRRSETHAKRTGKAPKDDEKDEDNKKDGKDKKKDKEDKKDGKDKDKDKKKGKEDKEEEELPEEVEVEIPPDDDAGKKR